MSKSHVAVRFHNEFGLERANQADQIINQKGPDMMAAVDAQEELGFAGISAVLIGDIIISCQSKTCAEKEGWECNAQYFMLAMPLESEAGQILVKKLNSPHAQVIPLDYQPTCKDGQHKTRIK